MPDETAVIQKQMEETRVSLTEKLETLEQQVVGTVQEATAAVQDTVGNVQDAVQDTVATVRETVQETVGSVKEFVDIEQQVARRPWLMFGGAVVLGYLGGRWTTRLAPMQHAPALPYGGNPMAGLATNGSAAKYGLTEAPPSRSVPAPGPTEPGLLSQLSDHFGGELNQLKKLAIGTTLGLVRDTLTRSVRPELGQHLGELVDSVTSKLGGQPFRGPLLEPAEDTSKEGSPKRGPGQRERALGAAP